MRRTALITTLLAASLFAMLGGCGSGGEEPTIDLTPVAESILPYPGARVHSLAAPPAGVRSGKASDYQFDRLYAVFGGGVIAQDTMLNFFRGLLPEQGWQLEDPMGEARIEVFNDYCGQQWVKCVSFTQGNIRAIISAPIRFSLNPSSNYNNNYHVHLEVFKSSPSG